MMGWIRAYLKSKDVSNTGCTSTEKSNLTLTNSLKPLGLKDIVVVSSKQMMSVIISHIVRIELILSTSTLMVTMRAYCIGCSFTYNMELQGCHLEIKTLTHSFQNTKHYININKKF